MSDSKFVSYANSENWKEEVINQEKVIVDFYSDDCAPCEALAPKFEALAELYYQDVKFVKIFRQENRELAEELDVRSSPTILFYENGVMREEKYSGGVKRSQMVKVLDQMVGEDRAKEIAALVPKKETECEILIVGGGPAGLSAAIYAAQAKRDVILVDPSLPGGQVSTTHLVSNYPGFVEPQSGMMLGFTMFEQAIKAGAKMKVAVEIDQIDVENHTLRIDETETIKAKKMILATGSSPRLLGLPGEKEYRGQGISYCATCDGKYFEDKEVIVIGGGNSAIEESLFLTQFASKVTIVHQFADLQANKVAQKAAFDNDKISFHFEHEPREFIRTERGMDVKVEDLKTKEVKTLSADGVFIFVGMVPNMELLNGDFNKDDWGYIKTDEFQKTNIEGTFAVGDIASKPYRQITVATAEGTVAGIHSAREIETELRGG